VRSGTGSLPRGSNGTEVIVRYLEYLTALARERHFARAAAFCNVTQPTFVPQTFLMLLQQNDDVIGLPLVEPDTSHVIGLVASNREPEMPMARELFAVAGQIDLATQIEQHIAQSWPSIRPSIKTGGGGKSAAG
jgi:hypothetical protein